MSILIKGYRVNQDAKVEYSLDAGETWFPLPMMLGEVNHSPSGFEWGYYGSGPSQLAYAILRFFYSEKEARKNYVQFKQDVIAKIPQVIKLWAIDSDDIITWFVYHRGLLSTAEVNNRYLTDDFISISIKGR